MPNIPRIGERKSMLSSLLLCGDVFAGSFPHPPLGTSATVAFFQSLCCFPKIYLLSLSLSLSLLPRSLALGASGADPHVVLAHAGAARLPVEQQRYCHLIFVFLDSILITYIRKGVLID